MVIPRKTERVTVERLEKYIKRFGPVTTTLLREAFGLPSNTSLFTQLKNSPNLVSYWVTSGFKTKMWAYKENTTTPVVPEQG